MIKLGNNVGRNKYVEYLSGYLRNYGGKQVGTREVVVKIWAVEKKIGEI